MKDWLAENWPYVVIALLYVLERSQAISSELSEKIRRLVEMFRCAANISEPLTPDNLKSASRAVGLYHDTDIDIALDKVAPEDTARVSKGAHILHSLIRILPIASRFLRAK